MQGLLVVLLLGMLHSLAPDMESLQREGWWGSGSGHLQRAGQGLNVINQAVLVQDPGLKVGPEPKQSKLLEEALGGGQPAECGFSSCRQASPLQFPNQQHPDNL